MRQGVFAGSLLGIALASGCGGLTDGSSDSAGPGSGGTLGNGGSAGGEETAGRGGTEMLGAGGTGGAMGVDDLPEAAAEDPCAPIVLDAPSVVVSEPVPRSALYLMIDRSAAMASSWDIVASSIERFVRAPESAHLEVALQYFPAEGGACSGDGYDTPKVPLGPSMDRASAIVASLSAESPAGDAGDSFEGAVRGGASFCAEVEGAARRRCAVVLVTASELSTCDPTRDFGELAEETEGADIYAVGLPGADFAALDAVSEASGVDCSPSTAAFACDAGADQGSDGDAGAPDGGVVDAAHVPDAGSSGLGVDQVLATARHAVSKLTVSGPAQVLICEYGVPEPPDGQDFNPNLLNVQIVHASGEQQILPSVASSAECDGAGAAWYYDDPADPERVILCPEACDVFSEGKGARAEMHLGCDPLLDEGP